jgi:hypothetical protein
VVVTDLEDVKFRDRKQAWEYSVNLGSMSFLMRGFRDVRYPRRAPSTFLYSMLCTVDSDDWSGLECPVPELRQL